MPSAGHVVQPHAGAAREVRAREARERAHRAREEAQQCQSQQQLSAADDALDLPPLRAVPTAASQSQRPPSPPSPTPSFFFAACRRPHCRYLCSHGLIEQRFCRSHHFLSCHQCHSQLAKEIQLRNSKDASIPCTVNPSAWARTRGCRSMLMNNTQAVASVAPLRSTYVMAGSDDAGS